ncbi:TPA: VRR-NUC domain-containing protein [Serratia marcescens]|nr:VRR-NUC domain-containing protein [Serratia marcescens]
MLNGIDVLSVVHTKEKLEMRGGKVKKVRHQPELEEQAALIEWGAKTVIDSNRIGDYLIHIPNERKRGPKAARDAKLLGLRDGVPDLFLALPRNGYAGLWIEMKSITGIATLEPIDWMSKLQNKGYSVVLSHSFSIVKDSVMKYMEK